MKKLRYISKEGEYDYVVRELFTKKPIFSAQTRELAKKYKYKYNR